LIWKLAQNFRFRKIKKRQTKKKTIKEHGYGFDRVWSCEQGLCSTPNRILTHGSVAAATAMSRTQTAKN
jgi:hypothetical protein